MPRKAKEMSAIAVKRIKENGLHFVGGAAGLALQYASSKDDVMKIFRKNKQLFDVVKKTDADFFTELMAKFTAVKNKFTETA